MGWNLAVIPRWNLIRLPSRPAGGRCLSPAGGCDPFPAVTGQLLAIREDQKADGPVRAFAAILSSPRYQFLKQTFLQPRRAMMPDARVPGGR